MCRNSLLDECFYRYSMWKDNTNVRCLLTDILQPEFKRLVLLHNSFICADTTFCTAARFESVQSHLLSSMFRECNAWSGKSQTKFRENENLKSMTIYGHVLSFKCNASFYYDKRLSWNIEDNVEINNILFWKLHFWEFFLCWNTLYNL